MRTPLLLKTTLATVALTAFAVAADGRLNGPVSAFVYDNTSRSVRPILGVLGAAYAGDALADGMDAAAFAPSGLAGLFVKDGGVYLMRQSAEGAWNTVRIGEGSATASIVWSGDSLTAAVIDGRSAGIYKLDGSLSATIAAIPGPVAAAALDGQCLIAAIVSDGGSGVYLLQSGSEAKLLARADKPVSVAVSGTHVFFADRGRNEVWDLRNYREGGDPRLVAAVEDPVGVAAAADLVVFASASGRKVSGVRPGSAEPVFDLALDFEPAGVERFGNTGWLLNAGRSGPLQVLAGGDQPAVYFVPRGQERNESAQ